VVKRILVATDRSESADRAVGWAADMAQRYDAELLLVQVRLPENPGGGDVAEELGRFAEKMAGPRGRARIAIGDDPAMTICSVADEEDADVVVVGNVGMSGRKEFLLGNVSNRVSHNAGCTVVIVDTSEPQRRGLFGRKR
jgi:nucleotide-binding universal stress UspA family protein